MTNKSFPAVPLSYTRGTLQRKVPFPRDAFLTVQRLERCPLNIRLKDGSPEAHITVVTPQECKKLLKEYPYFEPFILTNELTYEGLGVIETDDGNAVYFIIVEWKEADLWREMHGLPPHGYHITLGFRDKDVHIDNDGKRYKKNEKMNGTYRYLCNILHNPLEIIHDSIVVESGSWLQRHILHEDGKRLNAAFRNKGLTKVLM